MCVCVCRERDMSIYIPTLTKVSSPLVTLYIQFDHVSPPETQFLIQYLSKPGLLLPQLKLIIL